MPYFSNIRRLALNDNYTRVSYKQFLTSFTSVATNLTHLTLEGNWLFKLNLEIDCFSFHYKIINNSVKFPFLRHRCSW